MSHFLRVQLTKKYDSYSKDIKLYSAFLKIKPVILFQVFLNYKMHLFNNTYLKTLVMINVHVPSKH